MQPLNLCLAFFYPGHEPSHLRYNHTRCEFRLTPCSLNFKSADFTKMLPLVSVHDSEFSTQNDRNMEYFGNALCLLYARLCLVIEAVWFGIGEEIGE